MLYCKRRNKKQKIYKIGRNIIILTSVEGNVKLFENRVQEIKYKVLREVAVQTWKGNDVFAEFNEIADKVVKRDEPPQRCCIYKDRAIIAERIRLAIGGSKKDKGIVQVIDIACDECPEAGYVVTDLCRGCLAHNCMDACKLNAIYIDEKHHARIDKSKCVDCGRCASACAYSAIHNFRRPCESSCEVHAISMGPTGAAVIDEEKCVSCGACVYHCPFGATVDVSSIVDIVKAIKSYEEGKGKPVYALVAPAVGSQCINVTLGQVISGIKKLGFERVIEVALGADIVAKNETEELMESDFLTSSCCPAFVNLIEKEYPSFIDNISHNPSPMAEIGRRVKEAHLDCVTVFIGPCIAKKSEARRPEVSPYVDYVMTFEELQALFDSRKIWIKDLEESQWNQASYYGRAFGQVGGLTEAVKESLKEMNKEDYDVFPIVCDGLKECRTALKKAEKGVLPNNFIEGMACRGGCVGGSGNMYKFTNTPSQMKEHIESAEEKEIFSNIEKNKDNL